MAQSQMSQAEGYMATATLAPPQSEEESSVPICMHAGMHVYDVRMYVCEH